MFFLSGRTYMAAQCLDSDEYEAIPIEHDKLQFKPLKGECWLVDLGDTHGDVMNKYRPCVVVSENRFNVYSNCVTVVPITHAPCRRRTHTYIKNETLEGTAKAEQMRVISKLQLGKYICNMNRDVMMNISKGIAYHIFGDNVESCGENIVIKNDCKEELIHE